MISLADKQRLAVGLRKGLSVAARVADVAVQLQQNVGPLGVASLLAKTTHEILQLRGDFPLNEWSIAGGVGPMGDFLLGLARAQGLLSVVPTPGNTQVRVSTGVVNGVRVGWAEYERWTEGPYVSPDYTTEQAVQALRVLTWQACGSAVKFHQPPLGSPTLTDDSLCQPLRSQRADDRALAGRRRSVLLAGSPRTGKSSIVRYVAQQAGGLCLRFGAGSLSSLHAVGSLIQFLQPDVVAIDDLCRAEKPGAILDVVDEIMGTAKLLMVTVNFLKKLDGAVIGRFDAVEQVERLDDAVLDKLLDGVPPAIAKRLRDLPVKYIDQYRAAVDVLGHDAAEVYADKLIAQHALVQRVVEAAVPSTATPELLTKG